MPCKGFQPQVLQPEIQPAGQFDGAHDIVDWQRGLGEFSLRDQEGVIEGSVVGDHGAAVHQLG